MLAAVHKMNNPSSFVKIVSSNILTLKYSLACNDQSGLQLKNHESTASTEDCQDSLEEHQLYKHQPMICQETKQHF